MNKICDIYFFQQNERAAEFKANAVTPETRLILQQWMWSDYQLYNYFNHKLSDQIAEIGAKKVQHFCYLFLLTISHHHNNQF